MNDFTQGFLIALIPAFIVSIGTAIITAKLTTKEYYSQRWWEAKTAAYSKIMEQLAVIRYCLGKWIAELENDVRYTEEFKKKLSQEQLENSMALEKASGMGSFIITKDAADALEKLVSEMDYEDPNNDWHDAFSRHYDAISRCLEKLRGIAKKDLMGR